MEIKDRLLMTALSVFLIGGYAAANAESDNNVVTGKAPDFTLTDINGNEVSLSQFAGKVVVLEWTNYDCPFVQAHYDHDPQTMTELAIKYAGQDVVWLTINSTYYATPQAIKEWASNHGIEKQTVLIDTDGKVGKLYHARTTPDMFIIDKDGNIVYQGAIDNAPLGKNNGPYINYVDQALTQLLAGEQITIPQTKSYGCSVKYPPENKTPDK